MTDWLDTLDYLTPDQRRILRRHDLDAAVAFLHLEAQHVCSVTGLSPGLVGRLLASAHASASTPRAGTLSVQSITARRSDEVLILFAPG